MCLLLPLSLRSECSPMSDVCSLWRLFKPTSAFDDLYFLLHEGENKTMHLDRASHPHKAIKIEVLCLYPLNASFWVNGGQMASGQEISLSCTLGDSHNRERAVLCADTACHFFSPLRHLDTWRHLYGVGQCWHLLRCMVLFRRVSPERTDELDS
jgi:hypothetical protein